MELSNIRRAMPVLVHVVCIVSLTGCASPRGYLVDRGRDAADVFTATAGMGAGAQVRVGPIPLGVLQTTDVVGVRYGGSFHRSRVPDEPEEENYSLLALSGVIISPLLCLAGGAPNARYWDGISGLWYYHNHFPVNETQVMREKGATGLASPDTYQLEAVAGLGLVFRLGINIGELLDFGLGWTTVDIFGDDVEKTTQ